eukprot:scaffold5440_cov196-Pinguiococcus_pyrenoidosus.AAC.2
MVGNVGESDHANPLLLSASFESSSSTWPSTLPPTLPSTLPSTGAMPACWLPSALTACSALAGGRAGAPATGCGFGGSTAMLP